MIGFLTTGTVLGLSAGIAPGPLLALVVSETLRHGMKAGAKVALVPIISDLPIVALTLYILTKLSAFHIILGTISFLGGFVLLYMGYESLVTRGVDLSFRELNPDSFRKGILVNVLNPHPYLFWVSIGGPSTIKAWDQSAFAAVAFIGSFYLLLVGSKILVAVLVGRYRSFLTGRFYVYTMRVLGLILLAFALVLFRDGMNLMGFQVLR
ncbi:MAG: LysE family transporter [Deltaproteobacteria bacterium]|nr:LysE family transporter [Deltaproteobacteria bacterium]